MKITYLIIVLLLILTQKQNSQWEQVSSNLYGADISCMQITDSIIYAGTYKSGVFTSADKGISWVNISQNMYSKEIIDLTVSNNYIFAATEFDFQYTSNSGINWQKIKNENMSDISSVSSKNNFIYAGDRNTGKGFWFSSNYGKNWEQRNNGLITSMYPRDTHYVQIESIYAYDEYIFLGTLDFLYCSTNNGLNWKKIKYDDKYHSVGKIISTQQEVILLASRTDVWGEKHKLFKAKLDDLDFSEFGEDLFDENISDIAFDDGRSFASTRKGLYLSNDLGKNWVKKNSLFELRKIYLKHDLLLMCNWKDEFYRSTDLGSTFTEVSNGLFGLFVGSLSIFNNEIFAGTSKGNYVSNDLGQFWSRYYITFGNNLHTSILHFDNNIMVGTYNSGIYYSSDNGSNWFKRNSGLKNLYINKIIKSKDRLFAATGQLTDESGLYYSTNLGLNWIKARINSENYSVHDIIEFNNTLFIGTHSDGVYKSTNNGESWIPARKGLDKYTSRIEILFSCGTKIYAVGNFDGIYESEDLGENWFKLVNSPKDIRCIIVEENKVFAGTYNNGIFKSEDECKTWNTISTNTLLESTWSLLIKDGFLFAGTNSNGVWRLKLR